MKKIFNSFKSLSIGLKILIIFTIVIAISGISAATYMIINKENDNKEIAVNAEQTQENNVKKNSVKEDIIEEVIEEKIEIAQDVDIVEEEKEEKVVKYKDKEIKIPKSKVAAVNEKEDSQTQKTGGEKVSASDAVAQFENDGKYLGIDVSKHQGKIDWAQVKSSGVEFAMIRCGFRGQSEGGIYEDTYFKTNVNGAVSNGIKVGIYFYSCAINEEEALQEAAWVVDKIKSYRITFPVVYDFEDFGRYRCSGVSGEQATSNAIAFLNYVKNAGYTPMMYASKNDITNRFNRSRLSGYKFWLAHYTEQTNYTGSYQMWQYTSNGSVPGISGRVDMNVSYFTYGAVAEAKHTHDFDNGTVIKTSDSKEATCEIAGVKYIRCKECSESKKVEIPALGHKYGKWTTDTEKTTDELLVEYRECSVCKETEERKTKIEDTTNTTNTTNTTTNSTTNTTNTNTATNSTNTTNTTNTVLDTNTVTNTTDTNTTNSTDTNTVINTTNTTNTVPDTNTVTNTTDTNTTNTSV